jgi:hypothetical protein
LNHDDEKQLRILGWLHYVGAGLSAVIPLSGALYAAFEVAILLGRFPGEARSPGEAVGWLPLGMGFFTMLIGITAVTLNLLTARSLRDRKNHTLCVLTSAMNCIYPPLGTLLGALTIIVLCRPLVSAAFRSGESASGPLLYLCPCPVRSCASRTPPARSRPKPLRPEISADFRQIPLPCAPVQHL